jgi:DNA invertase Pin-like site-specific DNA recombinase
MLVSANDRSRNTQSANAGDCLTTGEQWERQGLSLHIANLGGNAIDTTSAAGRFMLVVLAGEAEMERNLTREWTRSALAVKRANGKRIGTVPYGFDLADDRSTLIPNDTEQAVIEDIRVMRKRGAKLKRSPTNSQNGVLSPRPGERSGDTRLLLEFSSGNDVAYRLQER